MRFQAFPQAGHGGLGKFLVTPNVQLLLGHGGMKYSFCGDTKSKILQQ
jgi:hypothetical protein